MRPFALDQNQFRTPPLEPFTPGFDRFGSGPIVRRNWRLWAVIAWGILYFLLPANALADRTVLLTNGEMLTGQVATTSELVTIRTTLGEMKLPRSRVLFIGGSPNSIYEYKLSRARPDDVVAQIDLTKWCLAQRLLVPAALQLNRLDQIAPSSDALADLKTRYELLAKPPKVSVQPVTHRRRVRPVTASPSSRQAPIRLPDLPDESLARFTRDIQPLFVNSCAAVSCHGRQTNTGLQFIAPHRNGHFTPRISRSNLLAALQHINFVAPDESALLQQAIEPHGGSSPAATRKEQESHDRQVATLRQWIRFVTGYREDAVESLEPDAAVDGEAATSATSHGADAPSGGDWESRVELRDSNVHPAGNQSNDEPTSTPAPAPAGRDPFDPEVFNSQFRGRG